MTAGILVIACLLGAMGGDASSDVCREYPDRVTALFAALDLDRPGVESVKKDVEAGDLPRACDDLLSYYRNGASGSWLRRMPPQPGTGQVPGADAILGDTFTADTISAKVPRLPDGHLDWSCNGPVNDREWGWDLNRHFWGMELLNAYFATGNPIYAKGLDSLLRDWIVSSPYPGAASSTPQWRGLEAFFRGGKAWPAAFYGLQQVDLLTPATRILLLSSIPEHADYARRFHKPTGNWITMELLGLATEGACWPEFKGAEEWYQYAVGRLVPELAAQVYPDGVQKELTSDYHRVAMHCFMDVPALAAKANRPEPPEFRATIERMQNYDAYSMEPNGYAPLNNDSDLEDIRSEVRAQSKEFNRPDWLYIATNGKEGEAPKGLPSVMFPWAGEFIMRSGWDADAHSAFFDVGPLGIAHQHYDKLHLSVSAFGRDILVDSGRYHYIGDAWRHYFTYSAAHNVVLVDGKCQTQYEKEASAPLDGSYAIAPEYDFAHGEYNGGFQDVEGTAMHARSVAYLRGRYFVVVDRITTDRPRTIQPLWHFHPACTVELEGADAASVDEGQGNVRIVPAAPFAWRAEIVKGRGEPDIQGWWSRHYNVKEPSPCVVYAADIKETATFAWVIIPGKGRVPAAHAEIVKADNDAVVVRVECEGKSNTVTVPLQGLGVTVHPAETADGSGSRRTNEWTREQVLQVLRRADAASRYRFVRENLDATALPLLYAILKDRTYIADWNGVAPSIAYLGEDPVSFREIIDYIRRYDPPEGLSNNDLETLVLGKLFSIRSLAFAGGEEGAQVLRSLLTDESYPEEFLKAWIHEPSGKGNSDYRSLVVYARCAAADGLVLTQIDSHIEEVKQARLKALKDLQTFETRTAGMPPASTEETIVGSCIYQIYSGLTQSVAADELVRSRGIDAYFAAQSQFFGELWQMQKRMMKNDGVQN